MRKLVSERQLSYLRLCVSESQNRATRLISWPSSALDQSSETPVTPQPLNQWERSYSTAALHKPPPPSAPEFLICKMRSVNLASPDMCVSYTHRSLLMLRDPQAINFRNTLLLPLGNSRCIVFLNIREDLLQSNVFKFVLPQHFHFILIFITFILYLLASSQK